MRGTQSRIRLISADSQDEDACMCDLSHKGRCGPEVSDQMLYYEQFYRKSRYFACNSDNLIESQASLRYL